MAGKAGKGQNTKRRYVEATCALIDEEGFEEVSIRKVAKRVGCDPAVLYRHFTNLEYLHVLAAMHMFEEYFDRLLEIEQSGESGIEMAIDTWDAFIDTAYENPQLYYRVFYACDPETFSNAIREYFELYPLDRTKDKAGDYGLFFMALYSNNSFMRSFYYFNRAANEGAIAHKDATYLSHAIPSIAAYQLGSHQKGFANETERNEARSLCRTLVRHTIDLCLVGIVRS